MLVLVEEREIVLVENQGAAAARKKVGTSTWAYDLLTCSVLQLRREENHLHDCLLNDWVSSISTDGTVRQP